MGATTISRPVRQLRVLPLRTLSDERLAELASVGHSDAFEALYERYRDSLARYCRSIVRDPDDAKDALQNTMVSVLRAVQMRVPAGLIRPWMYRIAHNESISIIRRRHTHEELSNETPDRADTELASMARDRLDELLVDLRSLPERQRGALVMRELGGLEYSEIADALEMSAVSARKAVFEARVALHDLATGRDANCDEIRLRMSNGDGRVLRARGIRGHLTSCASCSAFEQGLHDRRGAFGLIPVFPVLSVGALLGLALPGGGGSTSGFAFGGSAAAGSAIGGGSLAAVKGIALSGAIAVAGAGVLVGSGIGSHVTHVHRAQVVHTAPAPRHRLASTPVLAQAAKPVRVAVPRTARAPARSAVLLVPSGSGSTSARRKPAVASAPNVQGPSVALPVSATTPTGAAPSPAPAGASSPTTPPASAPPTTTTPAAAPAPAAAATMVNTIIQQALQSAGGNVAAAEAQAAQLLAQAGSAPGTPTIQSILSSILSGQHG
jgi:RNA polymerase sigma factor (sigma-70 family)